MEELLKEKEKLEATSTSTQQEAQIKTQTSNLDPSNKITQALGELSLRNKEMEKVTTPLTKMEENKIKVDNSYLEEA